MADILRLLEFFCLQISGCRQRIAYHPGCLGSTPQVYYSMSPLMERSPSAKAETISKLTARRSSQSCDGWASVSRTTSFRVTFAYVPVGCVRQMCLQHDGDSVCGNLLMPPFTEIRAPKHMARIWITPSCVAWYSDHCELPFPQRVHRLAYLSA